MDLAGRLCGAIAIRETPRSKACPQDSIRTGGSPMGETNRTQMQPRPRALVRLAPLILSVACGGRATETATSLPESEDSVDPRSPAEQAAEPNDRDDMRDVLVVGNSVSGTVSFIDGHTFRNLGSVDVIPDLQERLAEI